jgi:hypothetical protein
MSGHGGADSRITRIHEVSSTPTMNVQIDEARRDEASAGIEHGG